MSAAIAERMVFRAIREAEYRDVKPPTWDQCVMCEGDFKYRDLDDHGFCKVCSEEINKGGSMKNDTERARSIIEHEIQFRLDDVAKYAETIRIKSSKILGKDDLSETTLSEVEVAVSMIRRITVEIDAFRIAKSLLPETQISDVQLTEAGHA